MDAAALVKSALMERADGFNIAARIRPVNKDHSDDDTGNHTDRSDSNTERDTVRPIMSCKSFSHTPYRAVAALEAHFKKISERYRNIEHRREQKAGEPDTYDELSPNDDLGQGELRKNGRGEILYFRNAPAQKERGENNIDKKPRHAAHLGNDLFWNMAAI